MEANVLGAGALTWLLLAVGGVQQLSCLLTSSSPVTLPRAEQEVQTGRQTEGGEECFHSSRSGEAPPHSVLRWSDGRSGPPAPPAGFSARLFLTLHQLGPRHRQAWLRVVGQCLTKALSKLFTRLVEGLLYLHFPPTVLS